ncbi:MAG: hypothetical protein KY475_07465 [Planctomycetes bacterium]|nr:hypothetical protein [Planctomycetota bacterium]
MQLGEKHRLPSFGELEGRPLFADVRGAWSPRGFSFWVQVTGKRQMPWCRDSRLDESDGLSVWIDTRNTQNIHRASRFCHRFVFLPSGGGRRMEEAVAAALPINRAKEHPKPAPADSLRVRSQQRVGGYVLEAHIAAAALTGFDPAEHPRIGFAYAAIDRELGWQTFTVGPEFPFVEDPSLWGELELTP